MKSFPIENKKTILASILSIKQSNLDVIWFSIDLIQTCSCTKLQYFFLGKAQ